MWNSNNQGDSSAPSSTTNNSHQSNFNPESEDVEITFHQYDFSKYMAAPQSPSNPYQQQQYQNANYHHHPQNVDNGNQHGAGRGVYFQERQQQQYISASNVSPSAASFNNTTTNKGVGGPPNSPTTPTTPKKSKAPPQPPNSATRFPMLGGQDAAAAHAARGDYTEVPVFPWSREYEVPGCSRQIPAMAKDSEVLKWVQEHK